MLKMISIEECKRVLNKENGEYSDEQIFQIRDLVICLAEVYLESNSSIDEENSSDLHESIYRPAS
ncbi:MAG: hypothetical protein DRJ10_02530 [Bacteroidetes bacterium]|nr:MAG: hypothetical protein DRJ10_02530 [Bacteroidota bacterium]